MAIDIAFADIFEPLITTPKRIKILVGGRASTKSTFTADMMLLAMMQGHLVGCGREYQNSIDESVHRLMIEEYARLNMDGFRHDKSHIYHESGGRDFYRGLQGHSIDSIKSMLTGVHRFWIEEGGALTDETLKTLTSSLRLSAADVDRVNRGETVDMPEIWITMNRGKSTDPISRRLLKRAETDLLKHGIYEDDLLMVVQANYSDIPQSWFMASGLEQERADDEKNLDEAEYDHKWNGAYSDTVERAIIKPAWFDACIDAHIKLGFKATGRTVVTHDPADSGDDRAISYRKGSVFFDVQSRDDVDINDACDWATDYAVEKQADAFVWDANGVGLALKRDIAAAFKGKHTRFQAFVGGASPLFPDLVYDYVKDEESGGKKARTNKDVFFNARAQSYWYLRDRCWNTYKAVTKGVYTDPDNMISFSSNIKDIDLLRAELCSIPQKDNRNGKYQLVAKQDMDADSQNMGDCCAMSMVAEFFPERKQHMNITIPKRHSAFA